MLAKRNPADAYGRVELDARVAGASARQLVLLCYERLIASLDAALFAEARGDNRAKSAALTKALAALTALQLGLDQSHPLGGPLGHMFEAARASVLESVLRFDRAALELVRRDFAELAAAFA